MKVTQIQMLMILACVAVYGQQSTPRKYIQVDYMKVESGKGQQYVKLEQDLWKAVHKAQIENKNIEAWSLYAVRYPSGTNREYEFTTATTFSTFAALESPYRGIDLAKIHSQMTNQELGERTSSSRKLIRSDVFYTLERAGSPPPSWKYLEMQYMKAEPGKGQEYVNSVREAWKPVHEERVGKGLILAWGFAGLRYPAGANREYDYVTATYYDKFAALEDSYNGVDSSKAVERSAGTRKLVRGEVWALLDRVTGQ